MKITDFNYNELISDAFEKIQSNLTDEIRILTLHKWKNSAHQSSYFFELIRDEKIELKLRLTIWEIEKDTFRLKDVRERVKWIGKEFQPTKHVIEHICTIKESNELKGLIDTLKLNSKTNHTIRDLREVRINELKIKLNYSMDSKNNENINKLVDILESSTLGSMNDKT